MTVRYTPGDDNRTMFNIALAKCEFPILDIGFTNVQITKKEARRIMKSHENRFFWFYSGYAGSPLILTIVPIEEDTNE